MVESKTVSLTVGVRFKPGYTGILVGQCKEIPFIIVEGKTVQELTSKISHELTIYLKTFPHEGEKILEQYGKIVSVETDQINAKEGWTQQVIKVPILY